MTYLTDLEAAKTSAARYLRAKGVEEHFLAFTKQAPTPNRQPRIPTDSRSEFLANRAMGDWAESAVAAALRTATGKQVVHYGESDRIGAGDDGFADFYLARSDDVRRWGKRPDLLVFDGAVCPPDISDQRTADLANLARSAVSSIEVRSSKTEALKYIAVREAEGKKGARACPSFTVKVEDLIIVYRWLQHHPVPQFYVQLFFDSVYTMSVLDIFRALGTDPGITIEKNANNQLKSTIHVPITSGIKLGQFDKLPSFEARDRVTRLGRHDAFVEPVGGELALDYAALRTSGVVGLLPA